ncbi:hypothetical protein LMG28138_04214 [Pararobbsia alpina]|uniref:Uncharacterized protein n=1 Tax=Pararobbsia alpina TaxID=621374 RepID=A0A6S7BE16_9BURK|nr:hypothetical protein LMG28138_04214 [Pararobbsia alpina]
MFDQYEEDEAATPVVEVIADALKKRVQSLRVSDAITIEFVYGRASDHEPLTARVQRSQLLSEVTVFHDFLVNAVVERRCLSFPL